MNSHQKECLILVHGTGASLPTWQGTAWWQDGGDLWRWASSSPEWDVEAFIWSGANSERDRQEAGHRLGTRLLELQRQGTGFHVIGHSHGGSVIWHALRYCTETAGSDLAALRSWTTVGTPFLHYGVRRPKLAIALGCFLMSLAALALALVPFLNVHLGYAWRDEPGWTALWGLLLLLPIGIAVASIRTLVPFMGYAIRRRPVPDALVGDHARKKYLSLWSTQDEPTIGLGASGSFAVQFLQTGDPAVSVKNPGPWWRSTFNRLQVVSRLPSVAINQLVNNTVSRALQGSNLPHLELRGVKAWPHASLARPALAPHVDGELIHAADQHSADLGRRVRQFLLAGQSPYTGLADLTTAASDAFTFKELVHTTYFGNEACLELIRNHLCASSTIPAVRQQAPLVEDAAPTTGSNTNSPPSKKQLTLPSNRMAYVVMAALGLCAVVIQFYFMAQQRVFQIALSPTTGAHYLSSIIRTETVGAMLLSDKRTNVVNPRLDSFLREVLDADQGPAFMNILMGKDATGLHETFQRSGLERLMNSMSVQQIDWLLKQHGDVLGVSEKPLDERRIPSELDSEMYLYPSDKSAVSDWPYLGRMVDAYLASGALDETRFQRLKGLCGARQDCVDALKSSIAIVAFQSGASRPPEFVLPLSPSHILVSFESPRLETPEKRWVPRVRLRHGDASKYNRFVDWCVKNGRWDELAWIEGPDDASLHGTEVKTHVLTALGTQDEQMLAHVLSFALRERWSDPWSADELGALARAHERAEPFRHLLLHETGPRPTPASERERMRAPDRCHEPVLAPEVRESRVCREIHAEDQKRKRVNEAIAGQMAFPGEDGLLNAMYELGPRFTREDFGHLLDAWVVHMCTDRHQIMDENDNVRLGALIRHASDQTFDASKAESLVAKLESDAPFCEDGHQHTFPRKSGVEIDVLSAMLADRLVRTDEALAVRWMYSSAPVAIDHEYGMNYAAKATWLAERGYAVEAIEVARRNLWDAAPLARRSGLFQIATCLGLQGDQETADLAVGVALKAGAVEVNYHHIESPMPFLAEARYHLSKGDWRRAFASCQRCGAETKAAFGGAMLEAIKAKDLVSVIAKRARCEQLSGQSIGDVVRDEARRIR